MSIAFSDELADRSAWRVDNCPIALTAELIGSRASILVLREAFFGTRRFDEFVKRTRLTDAIVAGRLKLFTEHGLFEKHPYREPGSRTRYEYVLTPMGDELLPIVMALRQWGQRHLLTEETRQLDLRSRRDDRPVDVIVRATSGEELAAEDLLITRHRR